MPPNRSSANGNLVQTRKLLSEIQRQPPGLIHNTKEPERTGMQETW
jgi:hypothetical protein